MHRHISHIILRSPEINSAANEQQGSGGTKRSMNQFVNLVLSGLVTGAIYSIMATGLVLTYTTSGIFNFAHGAVAFATAYLYYQLNTGLGVPIVPSVIISVFVFAPAVGVVARPDPVASAGEGAGVRPDRRHDRSVGRVAGLGAVAGGHGRQPGLDLGLAGNQTTTNGQVVPGIGPTPAHVYHPFGGVNLNSDQVAVFVVAALAAIVLWFVLRRTRVGLEMRAVVDRESLAGLRGVNAARTSSVAWVLTMILAGLGGVLIAPLFDSSDFTFTLVVLGSLAAVVLGGLKSLPIAFAGGLLLGVVQNLVAGYSDDVLPHFLANLTGLKSAVPYLLVLILGLIIGRDRSRKAGSVADDIPRPDHRVGMSALKRRLPWIIFTICLIGFSLQWINVAWLAGRHLRPDRHRAEPGDGDRVPVVRGRHRHGRHGQPRRRPRSSPRAGSPPGGPSARDWGVNIPGLVTHGQINFLWAAVIAAVCGGALGAIIALPATRLGGVFLAIWTLAIAFFFSLVPFAYEPDRSRPTRLDHPRAHVGRPRLELAAERHPTEWDDQAISTSVRSPTRFCCSSPCSGSSRSSSTPCNAPRRDERSSRCAAPRSPRRPPAYAPTAPRS